MSPTTPGRVVGGLILSGFFLYGVALVYGYAVSMQFSAINEAVRNDVDNQGLLLTGMGRDGAEGLRLLHDAGALTIGQDEPTSVVWGMPAAAQALGAVEAELPLSHIAAALMSAVCAEEATT